MLFKSPPQLIVQLSNRDQSICKKETTVNKLAKTPQVETPTVYKITFRKLIVACALTCVAFALIWQVTQTNQSVDEALASTGTLRQTIYMTWASIALISSALGTIKWGWLGFWIGWLAGFIMAPAILLVVIMIRTGI